MANTTTHRGKNGSRNGKGAASKAAAPRHSNVAHAASVTATEPSAHRNGKSGWFTSFAQKTAQLAGKPSAFILATSIVVVWGITGPLFGYSGTWQLVINTGTTIVTFLMVFLIQHTQNRDSLAFQVKLDELIIKLQGAGDELAGAEDLCDEDLEALHEKYRRRAAQAHEAMEKRRAPR